MPARMARTPSFTGAAWARVGPTSRPAPAATAEPALERCFLRHALEATRRPCAAAAGLAEALAPQDVGDVPAADVHVGDVPAADVHVGDGAPVDVLGPRHDGDRPLAEQLGEAA